MAAQDEFEFKNEDIIPKTFFVTGCALVKNILINRGWKEVTLLPSSSAKVGYRQHVLKQKKMPNKEIMMKRLKSSPITKNTKAEDLSLILSATFIWSRIKYITFDILKEHQIINRFPLNAFTTKVGLSCCLQDLLGFEKFDSFNFFPRCYKLGMSYENQAFIEDYHLTTCICILKWIVDSAKLPHDSSKEIIIPRKIIDVILRYCETFIKIKNNEIICEEEPLLSPREWNFLLGWYFRLLRDAVAIPRNRKLFQICLATLSKMRYHWPQLSMEGKYNLWIIKPAAKARGEGIRILQNFKDIVPLISRSPRQEVTHVIQKYIERPLLIEGTKFDIRQWFLVTTFGVLTIYFYQDCYIRFCSKPFSLKDLSEATHLCNNSVQCRYKRSSKSSDLIPDEFMWTSDSFKEYLQKINQSCMWNERIYPGMKNSIIATVQATKGGRQCRKNCFELFGADFLLSDDFHPWLLEVNGDPCMAPTTQVTAELCKNVLKDTMKVVLDHREDPSCPIGKFQVIYEEKASSHSELLSVKHFLEDIEFPNPTLYPSCEYSIENSELEIDDEGMRKNVKTDELCIEGKAITSHRRQRNSKEDLRNRKTLSLITLQPSLNVGGIPILTQVRPEARCTDNEIKFLTSNEDKKLKRKRKNIISQKKSKPVKKLLKPTVQNQVALCHTSRKGRRINIPVT